MRPGSYKALGPFVFLIFLLSLSSSSIRINHPTSISGPLNAHISAVHRAYILTFTLYFSSLVWAYATWLFVSLETFTSAATWKCCTSFNLLWHVSYRATLLLLSESRTSRTIPFVLLPVVIPCHHLCYNALLWQTWWLAIRMVMLEWHLRNVEQTTPPTWPL